MGSTRSQRPAVSECHKAELLIRLRRHAAARWPSVEVNLSWRGRFAYVEANVTTDAAPMKLCRLGYLGQPGVWEFAFYKYSGAGYELSYLPSGALAGTPEECLDCPGVYLCL